VRIDAHRIVRVRSVRCRLPISPSFRLGPGVRATQSNASAALPMIAGAEHPLLHGPPTSQRELVVAPSRCFVCIGIDWTVAYRQCCYAS